jgi:hypothetical protein
MRENILKHGTWYSLEIDFRSGYLLDRERDIDMMDVVNLIHMDVGGLPPIPTGSFFTVFQFDSFFLVFGSLTFGVILRP